MDKESNDIYILFAPAAILEEEIVEYAVNSEIEAEKFLAIDPWHTVKKIKVFSTLED